MRPILFDIKRGQGAKEAERWDRVGEAEGQRGRGAGEGTSGRYCLTSNEDK